MAEDEAAAATGAAGNTAESESTSAEAAGAAPSEADNSASARWEFLEILAVVILAAESLRMVGSVVAGIINAATTPVGLDGQQRLVGSAIEQAANFSDGPGIVLLLLSLAMLWWRAEYWTGRLQRSTTGGDGDGGLPAEASQIHRIRALARWATVLFFIASAGALAYVVGNVLVNTAGGITTADQWQAYADDLFSVAYLIIAVAGTVASVKLTRMCDVDVALIDSTG